MTVVQFIRDLLGEYTPVTYQIWDAVKEEYYDIVPAGLAGIDWGYVCTAVVFVVVIFCTLKILGGIICKIF